MMLLSIMVVKRRLLSCYQTQTFVQHFDEASDGLYRKDLPLLGQDEI
jgi:hypothetical protein